MIEVKRLASDEYEILSTVQEGYCPDPDNSIAVIARNEGKILGRVLLIRPFHIEGTWIDEEYRKSSVGYRMFMHIEREARTMGHTRIFSYAPNEEIEGYLERLGYKKLPVTVWAKDL